MRKEKKNVRAQLQSSLNNQASILNLQRKLNGSWSARTGDGAESARKMDTRPSASRRSKRNKWTVYLRASHIRLVDVAIKYIEKFRAEIDNSLLSEESGLLPQREIFIAASEESSSGQGAGFIA